MPGSFSGVAEIPAPGADVARWALDAGTDGVAVFAADWTITYINAAGAAVLDHRVEDLVGRNMWEAFPEAVGTPFHECLMRAAATDEPVEWQAYYGPVRGWFTDRARRVGDHIVVVYTRADDQHRAELNRQRLAAQLRLAADRADLLLAASEAFTSAAAESDVVDIVANLTGSALSPGYVALALLEPDGAHLRRVSRDDLPAEVAQGHVRIPLSSNLPASVAARTARPVFLADLAAYAAEFADALPLARQAGLPALACAPMQGADGPLGALVLGWKAPRALDAQDRAVVTTLAGYAAQALQRIRRTEQRVSEAEGRLAAARAAVLEMQRSLLPDLPLLPAVELVAHYAPAGAEARAGGDWYDAVPFADGRVALVVGDVVGHGSAAAAAMAQLRAAAEHLLRADRSLGDTMGDLDDAAARLAATRAATVCIAVLAADGTLTWAAHGHPPPLASRRPARCGCWAATRHGRWAPAGRPPGSGRPCWPRTRCSCSTPTAWWRRRTGTSPAGSPSSAARSRSCCPARRR